LNLLNPMYTSSKMLHCQVNDLLDSSLLLKGKFEIKVDKFDIFKSVHEVVGIMHANTRLRHNDI
jgi:K+-sensing histidine kinase KdpD